VDEVLYVPRAIRVLKPCSAGRMSFLAFVIVVVLAMACGESSDAGGADRPSGPDPPAGPNPPAGPDPPGTDLCYSGPNRACPRDDLQARLDSLAPGETLILSPGLYHIQPLELRGSQVLQGAAGAGRHEGAD
jgi:hypothetical protein